MTPYDKPPLNSPQLVDLLKQRGMLVDNADRAIRYLDNVGYYRLSAYFYPFYETKDHFQRGVAFNQVLSLYIFDRKLRLLTLDALQRIEIAIRTAISNHMALKYQNPFWFLQPELFKCEANYRKFINIAKKHVGDGKKGASPSCAHYFDKYGDRDLPPSWILIEELPMGCWSKLYSNLANRPDQRAIADQFGFNLIDLESWLERFTIIRNICAHHRRFWNTRIPIRARHLPRYIQDAGDIEGPYQKFSMIYKFIRTFIHSTS